MLLEKENACLLLVDVQEKLTPHVNQADRLVSRCDWLMRLAAELQVPLLACEQYPQGLGGTVGGLQARLPASCISKVDFSGYCEPKFAAQWQALQKKQVVIMGIETHVCVLQTAFDMHHDGIAVFVVADAVSSRHEIDHKVALRRMQHAGIQVVTAEMVFFEWVRRAGTASFKALSAAFLK